MELRAASLFAPAARVWPTLEFMTLGQSLLRAMVTVYGSVLWTAKVREALECYYCR
jgi:hypothetical protein